PLASGYRCNGYRLPGDTWFVLGRSLSAHALTFPVRAVSSIFLGRGHTQKKGALLAGSTFDNCDTFERGDVATAVVIRKIGPKCMKPSEGGIPCKSPAGTFVY